VRLALAGPAREPASPFQHEDSEGQRRSEELRGVSFASSLSFVVFVLECRCRSRNRHPSAAAEIATSLLGKN
jgi:hypothetical protein